MDNRCHNYNAYEKLIGEAYFASVVERTKSSFDGELPPYHNLLPDVYEYKVEVVDSTTWETNTFIGFVTAPNQGVATLMLQQTYGELEEVELHLVEFELPVVEVAGYDQKWQKIDERNDGVKLRIYSANWETCGGR